MAGLLTPAEQAEDTALWTASLDETATVLRPTYTRTAGSERTVTWSAVASGVAARWARVRIQGREGVVAGAVLASGPGTIKLVAGTSVLEKDRLQRDSDSSLWEVQSVDVRPYGVLVDARLVTA
jgi:hypothetical protein